MNRRIIILLSVFAILALFTPISSFATQSEPDTRVDINAPAVPGQFVIKFRPGTASHVRESIVRAQGGHFFDRIAALDVDAAEFPALKAAKNPRAAEGLIRALQNNPNVEYVEPNYIYKTDFTPNDPGLSQQWAWNRIQAFAAWDVTRGSSSTVIAIVDTGIQRSHPDLDSKIVAGYDYIDNDASPDDGNGHGTHVGGTSAAETNNSTGGAGTCPNCNLMPVRVLDNNGSGSLVSVANGITFAANNGAKVINLSLGGSGGSSTLQSAVDDAWNKGVFLACAAGNSNTTAPSYPAYYTNCYAVASTNSSDARSSFSNYGSWVEIAAPGEGIYSTWLNNGYNTISGTSMATPHVAGLAGLMSSQGLTNAQIRDRMCSTADRISGTGSLWTCGRINALNAVSGGGGPTPTPTPPVGPTPTPPPSGDAIVNGGFENGTSPWGQTSPGGYQLIDTTRPRTGSYSAYLGDYNGAYDRVFQLVTVPSNGTLTYHWYQTSQEGTGTAYDFFRVRLYDSNQNLIATVREFSNRNARNGWFADSINLSSYAGRTVYVHFSVATDASLPTAFFVDDVSLR